MSGPEAKKTEATPDSKRRSPRRRRLLLRLVDRRRGTAKVAPNVVTTLALYCGFVSITLSGSGRFELAAIAIVVAGILDGFDGMIARAFDGATPFGAMYDSLSDLLGFGLAPALLFWNWTHDILGGVATGVAFVYVTAAAIRLARYNTKEAAHPGFFSGLPSTAAAGLACTVVWSAVWFGYVGEALPMWIAIGGAITFAVEGLLMVSRFPFISSKSAFVAEHPVRSTVILMITLALVSIEPPVVLMLIGYVYLCSPLVTMVVARVKHG